MSIRRDVAQLTHPLKIGLGAEVVSRAVPEEVPIAIVCNGTSVGVMMATPADFTDFALGFYFSEGIVESLEVVEHDEGIEIRLWIEAGKANRLLAAGAERPGRQGAACAASRA